MIRNLTLESEFFPVEVGTNVIKIEKQNADGTGVTGKERVYWRERFL
ncbi:hypothetical protein [Bacillus thuringiensis]|nr:hypothetical protein [Bacillus thuringiensis]